MCIFTQLNVLLRIKLWIKVEQNKEKNICNNITTLQGTIGPGMTTYKPTVMQRLNG